MQTPDTMLAFYVWISLPRIAKTHDQQCFIETKGGVLQRISRLRSFLE